MAKMISFRRLKRGDPVKFKVLAEDMRRGSWLNRLTPAHFAVVVLIGSVAMMLAVYVVDEPRTRQLPSSWWKSTSSAVGQSARPNP